MSRQQMGGVSVEWTQQVTATLVELARRVAHLEARGARLDAHSSELAAELLAAIERGDRLAAEQAATARALADHLTDHRERGR